MEHEHKKPEDEKNKSEIKDEELDNVSGGRGAEADVRRGGSPELRHGAEPENRSL